MGCSAVTLLHFDGFDTAGHFERYIGEGSVNNTTPAPRFGYGQYWSASGGGGLGVSIPPSAEVITGAAHSFEDPFTNLVHFYTDNGNTRHITVLLRPNGAIEVIRGSNSTGSSGTVIATAPLGTLPAAGWTYVEVRCTIDDSTGAVEIRADGSSTPSLSFTGDTRNGGTSTNIDRVELRSGSSNNGIDDWYVLNTSGAAPHNTWLGDVRVFTLLPNGNGNSSQLVGSDGNSIDNYLLVDDLTVSIADYVGSATPGQKDTYAMENLPAGVSTVFGTFEVIYALKTDGGYATAKSVLRSGGTDYTSDALVLGPAVRVGGKLRTTDPATGSAWTASGVNAAEVGVEVG